MPQFKSGKGPEYVFSKDKQMANIYHEKVFNINNHQENANQTIMRYDLTYR